MSYISMYIASIVVHVIRISPIISIERVISNIYSILAQSNQVQSATNHRKATLIIYPYYFGDLLFIVRKKIYCHL